MNPALLPRLYNLVRPQQLQAALDAILPQADLGASPAEQKSDDEETDEPKSAGTAAPVGSSAASAWQSSSAPAVDRKHQALLDMRAEVFELEFLMTSAILDQKTEDAKAFGASLEHTGDQSLQGIANDGTPHGGDTCLCLKLPLCDLSKPWREWGCCKCCKKNELDLEANKHEQSSVKPVDIPLWRQLCYLYFTYWRAYLEFCTRFDVEGLYDMEADELASGFHLLGLEVDVFELEQICTEASVRFHLPEHERDPKTGLRRNKDLAVQHHILDSTRAREQHLDNGADKEKLQASADAAAQAAIQQEAHDKAAQVWCGFLKYIYVVVKIFDRRSDMLADGSSSGGTGGSSEAADDSFAWGSFFGYMVQLSVFPLVAHLGMRLIQSTAERKKIVTFRVLLCCLPRNLAESGNDAGVLSPLQSRVLTQFRFLCSLLQFEYLLVPGWHPLQWVQRWWRKHKLAKAAKAMAEAEKRSAGETDGAQVVEMVPHAAGHAATAGVPTAANGTTEHALQVATIESRIHSIALMMDLMWALMVCQPILFFALQRGFSREFGVTAKDDALQTHPLQCVMQVEGFLPLILNCILSACVCAILSVPALRSSEQWRRITDEDGLRTLKLKNAKLHYMERKVVSSRDRKESAVGTASPSKANTHARTLSSVRLSLTERGSAVSGSGSPSVGGEVRTKLGPATPVPLPHAEALIVMMELRVNHRLRVEDVNLQDSIGRILLRYTACVLVGLAPSIVRAAHQRNMFCAANAPLFGAGDATPYSSAASTFLVLGNIFVIAFSVRLIIYEMISCRRALSGRIHRMEMFSELLYPSQHAQDRTKRNDTHPPAHSQTNGAERSSIAGTHSRTSAAAAARSGDADGDSGDDSGYSDDEHDDPVHEEVGGLMPNQRSGSSAEKASLLPSLDRKQSMAGMNSTRFAGSKGKRTLRYLIDSYLVAESGTMSAAHDLVSSLSMRFRCSHPANCISWWNVRVYLSSVKAHEVKRMEIFLSVLVLLLLGCVSAPIVVLLLSGTPHSLSFQSTTATAGLLAIIIAVFMARVLQMAVRLNQLAASHTNVLKQEMVGVLFRKTVKTEKARKHAMKQYRRELAAVNAANEAAAEEDKPLLPLPSPPVINADEFAYMDVSLQLLERMVQSLEEDYGSFRLFGLELNAALLNSLFSVVGSGALTLIGLIVTKAQTTFEQGLQPDASSSSSTGMDGP
jgi:hypothetical protein